MRFIRTKPNHRGLDWKSVDTDADVGAMHSEWSIKRTNDRNLIQKIRVSNRDRSNDSSSRTISTLIV